MPKDCIGPIRKVHLAIVCHYDEKAVAGPRWSCRSIEAKEARSMVRSIVRHFIGIELITVSTGCYTLPAPEHTPLGYINGDIEPGGIDKFGNRGGEGISMLLEPLISLPSFKGMWFVAESASNISMLKDVLIMRKPEAIGKIQLWNSRLMPKGN